jgi:hypothetical protein
LNLAKNAPEKGRFFWSAGQISIKSYKKRKKAVKKIFSLAKRGKKSYIYSI